MKRSLLAPVVVAVAMPLCFVGRTVSGQAPRQTADVIATLRPDGSRERVDAFRTKGNLSEKGASFLARTKFDVLKSDKNVHRFTAAFPNGAAAGITYRLTPNQRYSPAPPGAPPSPAGSAREVKLLMSATATRHIIRLSYVVPAAALRTSASGSPLRDGLRRNAIQAATETPAVLANYRAPMAAYASDRPLRRTAGRASRMSRPVVVEQDQEAVRVIIDVAVAKGQDELRDAAIGKVEDFLVLLVSTAASGTGGLDAKSPLPVANGVSAINDVYDVASSGQDYVAMVKELDALQAQAENPTNGLTKKMYAEDPGSKQRILDEIAEVRFELKEMQAVLFGNSFTSVAMGLLENPLVNVGISPLVAQTNRTGKEFMNERMRNIRNLVTTGFTPGKRTKPPAGTPTPSTFVDPEELAPKPPVATEDELKKSNAMSRLYGCKPTDGLTLAIQADDGLAPSPPGVFTAVYEGVQNEFSADGTLSHTTKESGTITFRVKPDGRLIDGSGNGKASFERKDDKSRTFGETAVTFPVSGFVNGGAACLVVAQGLQPMDFETVQTYFDPKIKPYYGNRGVPTDMLFAMTTWPALGGNPANWPVGGALRLRHGSTHTWSVDVTSKAGRRTTARSTLTIQ